MAITPQSKTATREYFAGDQNLPALGQIQLLPSSLPSQEQDLVTGDVRRNITGNLFYDLIGNKASIITGNENEEVFGNRDFFLQGTLIDQVVGTATQTKYGKHFYHNASERTDTFTGTVNRFYQAQLVEHHPETWLRKIQTAINFEWFAMKSGVEYLTILASATSFYGIKADFSGLKIDASWRRMDFGGTKLEIYSIKNAVLGYVGRVVATAILAGVLYAGTPFKPNALPRPTPITPFD
jgi:hypothetical protein